MLRKEIMMEVEVLGDALLYAKQRQWRVFDVGETGANVVRVRGWCPCFRCFQCTCLLGYVFQYY